MSDDLGIEGGAAAGDAAHRVEEVVDLEDAVLEQVAGFFKLLASDTVGLDSLVVRDSASSFVSMPFVAGDKVKITKTPRAAPRERRPGPGAMASHLRLRGEGILRVTDTSGNVTEAPCRMPPSS